MQYIPKLSNGVITFELQTKKRKNALFIVEMHLATQSRHST